jgi:WD40 repeat protein
LLSAASEGAIKVWNWKTNEEIRTIAESSENLVGLALSGDYVAVATDMSVTIWNWQTGVAFCAFNEDKSRFLDVSLVEDEIAIVTSDNIVDIWNWRTGKNLNSIEELEGAVLRTHLKGELVLCILEDQTLKYGIGEPCSLLLRFKDFADRFQILYRQRSCSRSLTINYIFGVSKQAILLPVFMLMQLLGLVQLLGLM